MHGTIIIPARYASSRFPGKPLHIIAGKTMLQHVYSIALQAVKQFKAWNVLIATDDNRIMQHAHDNHMPCVMTPKDCKTGTDRVLCACKQLDSKPNYIINLQGDAPLTPVNYLIKLISAITDQAHKVLTLGQQLKWQELDDLRAHKVNNKFSGTCITLDQQKRALWFSKNIIPAIRNEDKLRVKTTLSPVIKHIGIYGFAFEALQEFVKLPQSHYEKLEELEQLRLIENSIPIHVELVVGKGNFTIGVDTKDDAILAEKYLHQLHENV